MHRAADLLDMGQCSGMSPDAGVTRTRLGMGVHPLGKPLHPCLLVGGLHGFWAIRSADPRNGVRRRHASEDGHARQHSSGTAAPAQAADLDEPIASRSAESLRDLLRGKLWILR